MEHENKFETFSWAQFLSNFCAVVLGIAITLIVNKCVEDARKEENVKEVMTLVKEELRDNISLLTQSNKMIKDDAKNFKQLCDVNFDLKKISNFDSVMFSINAIYLVESKPFSEKILTSSGVLNEIKNKRLVLDIANAFINSDMAIEMQSQYNKRKQNLSQALLNTNFKNAKNAVDSLQIIINNPEVRKWLGYYKSIGELTNTVDTLTHRTELIVNKIEQAGY